MASIYIENPKTKARLPGLYDNPYRRADLPGAIAEFDAAHERVASKRPSKEVAAKRRRIAGVTAGLLLSPLLIKAYIDSYSYGYHPHPTPPAAEGHHNK